MEWEELQHKELMIEAVHAGEVHHALCEWCISSDEGEVLVNGGRGLVAPEGLTEVMCVVDLFKEWEALVAGEEVRAEVKGVLAEDHQHITLTMEESERESLDTVITKFILRDMIGLWVAHKITIAAFLDGSWKRGETMGDEAIVGWGCYGGRNNLRGGALPQWYHALDAELEAVWATLKGVQSGERVLLCVDCRVGLFLIKKHEEVPDPKRVMMNRELALRRIMKEVSRMEMVVMHWNQVMGASCHLESWTV